MSATHGVPAVPQEDLLTLFSTARKLHKAGMFSYARLSLESCLPTATDSVMRLEIHTLLGECCQAMGNRAQAAHHFNAAITLGDQSEKGRLLTALCLNWLKRYEEGLSLAQKVLESNPSCTDAEFVKIKIYESMGDNEKASELKSKLDEAE